MTTVGLIANPAAGRDIRRLVGLATVVPNHEKVAIVRRVVAGLAAAGVKRLLYLPDSAGIARAGVDDCPKGLRPSPLKMVVEGAAEDSTLAAKLLGDAGAAAVITLGGDGTNRAVAAGCGDLPLVPISTGTNNVFPTMIDGTVAGLAAGLVATGVVERDAVCTRAKVVRVLADGVESFALIDVAVCSDSFVGARAVWDAGRVLAVVLARTDPWAVGLSSIGGRLARSGAADAAGLYIEVGPGRCVRAVLAPGLVVDVPVKAVRRLELEEEVELPPGGVIAFDGEREIRVTGPARASVVADGPFVVDIRAVLAAAADA